MNDANKPLISKLLAVPAWRELYLRTIRDIAEKWLDWNRLGPIVASYRQIIAEDVKSDTRKLDTFDEFEEGLSEAAPSAEGEAPRGRIRLKTFAEKRRAYLLGHPEVKKLDAAVPQPSTTGLEGKTGTK